MTWEPCKLNSLMSQDEQIIYISLLYILYCLKIFFVSCFKHVEKVVLDAVLLFSVILPVVTFKLITNSGG